MANKIKCTCGHSWDKSDSSKKDMYVCHICGKDNTMKDGGWLSKYDVPEAQNGIEGTMGGLTDKGFNYNGAWGGPSMQVGGTVLKFLEPTSKKLPEGYNPSPMARGTSTEYAISIGGEDGEPAYLIPSFKHGELLLDPKAEFRRTGEHLGGPFKTYQEADEWERTVRHPYVEKGQSIPTPIKRWGNMENGGNLMPAMAGANQTVPMAQLGDSVKPITMQLAMGGSLPGAVGFTYARTAGAAPANGPYAKKTKASAQNGMEMKYYQQGLDFKPKTISQDGSEIPIDPMGYWNPENVGNPVIIPSNIITMKDVDQPLLGISDTGDVQMMYPGEDYEFDGETVTEYPVMQKGGRLPIYVDNPNDPRLKSYTDSLNLYKAMLMQDKLMGPNYNNDDTQKNKAAALSVFSTKELKEARKKKIVPKLEYLGPVSRDFQNEKDMFSDPYFVSSNDKKLIKYYKSLGFTDDNIMYHTSADLVHPNIKPIGVYHDGSAWSPIYKKPEQPVEYRKPEGSYLDKFGLTTDDMKRAFASKPVINKDNVYYNIDKGGKKFRVHTQSGGLDYIEEIKQPKVQKKTELKQELVKKQEPTTPIVERKQNVYEGSPVYSPGVGSGMPSALIGFANQRGDTTYIKPEDYDRFAVPKYAKEYIESKKKQRNGGVNKADEYPIEKLDQSLNFTNYNKPTKGGWLDKYK